jgi:plasmid stabilization system protein ParE
MRYLVRTTRRVDREISRIVVWYLERSGTQDVADRWAAGLRALINTLASNPQRHSLARETSAFEYDVRELLYGSGRRKTHRILFRTLESDGIVEVIGVRHVAQRDFTPDDM